MLIDDIAAGGHDALNAVRLVVYAAIGIGHIGCGQLYGRDAIGHGAKRQGKVPVAVLRGNAHSGQVFDRSIQTDLFEQPDSGGIEGVSHGSAQGHVAIVPVARIAGRVAAGEARLFIQKDGGGGIALFKRRAVDGQRLEG